MSFRILAKVILGFELILFLELIFFIWIKLNNFLFEIFFLFQKFSYSKHFRIFLHFCIFPFFHCSTMESYRRFRLIFYPNVLLPSKARIQCHDGQLYYGSCDFCICGMVCSGRRFLC